MQRSSPYRFLFVSAPFSGIEVFFRNLLKVLQWRTDIETTWEWIDYQPKEFIARLPIVAKNWSLKGGLVGRSRIRRLERAGRIFDAVLFNHLLPLLFLRDFQRRVPTVLSLDTTPTMIHGFDPWYVGKRSRFPSPLEIPKRLLVRQSYMACRYILPWTNLVGESLQRNYGIPREKLKVLPPGIELSRWDPPASTRKRRKGDPINILFVGGEFLRKGGDLVLAASRKNELQECTFHIVTHEPVGPTGPNVQVHADIGPNEDELKRLYAEADIFVLPTKADFAPTIAVCEAMAMRLPIITTRVGGLEEVVRDGESGFVVPSGDADLLTERIQTLVNSPAMRRRFGDRGREIVEERFNLTKTAGQIVTLLCAAADGAHVHGRATARGERQ